MPVYMFYKAKLNGKPVHENMNVFLLATIPFEPKVYDNIVVIVRALYEECFEKVKAISVHPLLPNSISQPLFDVLTCGREEMPNPNDWPEKSYFVIGNSDISYSLENNEQLPLISLHEFQQKCLMLKNAILNWFESNGLTDINHLALMNTKNLEAFTGLKN